MLIPFGVFSAGVGGDSGGGSFDLISTTLISSNTASVTFDVTGLGSTYKHLQIRATARTTLANIYERIKIQFNSDTGANYAGHVIYTEGSGVTSTASTSTSSMYDFYMASANATGNAYGGFVTDILDPFSTSKNKTIRTFFGTPNIMGLASGFRNNTAAITTITLSPNSASFASGTRLSIYGVKG